MRSQGYGPRSARVFSRRGFVAGAGVAAVGTAAGFGALRAVAAPYGERAVDSEHALAAHVCCDGCENHCTALAAANEGSMGRVVVDGLGPFCERGYTAARSSRVGTRVLEPSRLDGSRRTKMTWEDAFETVGAALATAGSGEIVALVDSADPDGRYISRLMDALGAPGLYTVDRALSGARRSAVASVLGGGDVMMDPSAANLVIAIGASAGETQDASRTAALARARAGGAYTVLIDAVNATPALYDEWIAVRPGTEGALLAAVAKQLCDDGAVDRAFIEDNVEGYDAWSAALASFTRDWAAEITGVSAACIDSLAARIAAAGATTSFELSGVGAFGNAFASSPASVRTAVALAAVCGALGETGSTAWVPDMVWGEAAPSTKKKAASTSDHELADDRGSLGEALEIVLSGHPRVLILDDVDLSGVVDLDRIAADANLMTVALATQENATTAVCDVVLPKAAYFEHVSLPVQVRSARPAVAVGDALVEPPDDAETMRWICCGLAQRCGCLEAVDIDEATLGDELLAPFGLTTAGLAASGSVSVSAPADYGTPSGRIELASDACARAGVPELCLWDEAAAVEPALPGTAWLMAGFGAVLPDTMIHDAATQSSETPVVMMNRDAADELRIEDGETITLASVDGDALRVRVELSDLVHPEALWWDATRNGSYPRTLWGAPEATEGFGSIVLQSAPVVIEKAGA